MLNQINLCGRLVQSPELKTTQSGKSVTTFTLAVERDYAANGERETDFIPIVAYGKVAEFATTWFSKGKMMIVSGRLQVRKYQTQNGENRYVTEVIANNVYFAGDKSENRNNVNIEGETQPQSNTADDFTDIDTDDELPF